MPPERILLCFDFEGRWGSPHHDGCELAHGADEMLGVLAKHRARAVFFVVGELAERHPDVVAAIASAGHELALHGWRHERLIDASEEECRRVVEKMRAAASLMEDLAGAPVLGFRAPFLLGPSYYRQYLYELLASAGYRWVSNRELRFPIEIVRPDRIGSSTPWRLLRKHEGITRGRSSTAMMLMLNAGLILRDPLGGSPRARLRWVADGAPPVIRDGLVELPLHGPLDCDLLGFPRSEQTSGEHLLDYALFALTATARNARGYAMATFHDWLIASADRLSLLDKFLGTLSELGIPTSRVEESLPVLRRGPRNPELEARLHYDCASDGGGPTRSRS